MNKDHAILVSTEVLSEAQAIFGVSTPPTPMTARARQIRAAARALLEAMKIDDMTGTGVPAPETQEAVDG